MTNNTFTSLYQEDDVEEITTKNKIRNLQKKIMRIKERYYTTFDPIIKQQLDSLIIQIIMIGWYHTNRLMKEHMHFEPQVIIRIILLFKLQPSQLGNL